MYLDLILYYQLLNFDEKIWGSYKQNYTYYQKSEHDLIYKLKKYEFITLKTIAFESK